MQTYYFRISLLEARKKKQIIKSYTMKYFEETLYFEEEKPIKRSLITKEDVHVLGITLRLGNTPIVKDLKKLYEYSVKTISN